MPRGDRTQCQAVLLESAAYSDRRRSESGPAKEENDGKSEENNDSDVRIRDMPTNLLRQYKQPGNPGSRDQGNAGEAQPMSGEDEPSGPATRCVHGARLYPRRCENGYVAAQNRPRPNR